MTTKDTNSYAVTDINSRSKKAEKIIAVLNDFCGSLFAKRILDIGCGTGTIGSTLARLGNEVISVDITDKNFNLDLTETKGVNFQVADAQNLPYKTEMFDIVICNHILEHVTSKRKVIVEIKRVLKREGICYLANGNILWPIEPHYKLPFLSYLPYSLANKYIKAVKGRGRYDISLPSYWELEKLISYEFKEVTNFTISIIKKPKKYHAEDVVSYSSVIPYFVLKKLMPYLPGWIYIVKK